MGTGQSDAKKQNDQVTKELKKDAKKSGKVHKLLFLGSGGSGKSTLFKQLQVIYGDGFSKQDRKAFKTFIHEQAISQMILATEMLDEYRNGDLDDIMHKNQRNYIDNYDTNEITEEKDTDNDEFDRSILELSAPAKKAAFEISGTSYTLTDKIVAALKVLWKEPGIRKMYEMRNITRIDDNSAYFWHKLDELNDPNYLPDNTDILKVRHRTTGTREARYDMPNNAHGSFSITDVGGQRSERKKWIQCFHGVTSVIFVASLSCYDEVLDEDHTVSSMTDQLELFDEICNDEVLKKIWMIIFLNKKDIFEDKIKKTPLTKCLSFVNYQGKKDDLEQTTLYIAEAFKSLNNAPNMKKIITHVTCATERNNIKKVFIDVQQIVVETSLMKAGIYSLAVSESKAHYAHYAPAKKAAYIRSTMRKNQNRLSLPSKVSPNMQMVPSASSFTTRTSSGNHSPSPSNSRIIHSNVNSIDSILSLKRGSAGFNSIGRIEQYEQKNAKLQEEVNQLTTENDSLKQQRFILKKQMKDMEKMQRINCGLAMHYMNYGRNDYFDQAGKGKFVAYIETNKLTHSSIIKIDKDFPVDKEYDNQDEKNKHIFKIVQYCFIFGIPPPKNNEEQIISWNVDDCKSVEDCQMTKNIISALINFATLSQFEKEETKSNLVKYCKEEYPEILNEYIHILTVHNNDQDLIKIHKSLSDEYDFIECNIENCAISLRHYRDTTKHVIEEKKISVESDDFSFYRGVMDQIHCYLFHMWDTGMRINEENEKKDDNPFEEGYIDNKFENMRDIVKLKLEHMRTVPGLNTRKSSKFTIKTIEERNVDEGTLMDGLLVLVGTLEHRDQIMEMILNEEYDSDAVDMDISDKQFTNSNIGLTYEIHQLIREYFYDSKLFSRTFNIGYRFYYWWYYKDPNVDEQNEYWNINDHQGHSPTQLFVPTKYKDIKEEILYNEIFCLQLYQLKISTNKVYKYIKTKKSKSIEAFEDEFVDRNQYLHYNIHKGDAISKKHLLSIVLYCDWSDLSTAFSATFRKAFSHENVSTIKERNSQFANWSRLLRETVEMFGKSPQSLNSNRLKGPFYSGIHHTMVIPEFDIRLCAPTSTSTAIEVATRFAGEGIIIQLNDPDDDLSAFSCSWMSNYASEAEFVFCGGFERIQIESVRNMATGENFQPFFRALFCFDKMVNSNYIANTLDVLTITDDDRALLIGLIEHKLGDSINRYPRYINNTFDAFVNHKSQIVINLYNIQEHFTKISDLIMEPSKTNLFKSVLFRLFPNIKTIIIQSTEQIHENPFDLLELLNQIHESDFKSNTMIIIKAIHQESKQFWDFEKNHKGGSWILEKYNKTIVEKYRSKKLNIKLDQKKNIGNVDAMDDCLEISFL